MAPRFQLLLDAVTFHEQSVIPDAPPIKQPLLPATVDEVVLHCHLVSLVHLVNVLSAALFVGDSLSCVRSRFARIKSFDIALRNSMSL